MPAPANDAQAAAETVTVGPYWGVIEGTTVDATEDVGGPFDGFGAQEVWYTWSSLPAGLMFFYAKPAAPGDYIEIGAWSCAPGGAVDTGDVFAYGGGDDTTPQKCVAYGTHTGGPVTVAVVTYVGAPGPTTFQVGWGHQLDATVSHWGAVQEDPWAAGAVGASGTTPPKRGIKQTYVEPVPGTGTPAGHFACVYENARDGVVHIADPFTEFGCTYMGPGVGTTTTGFVDPAGQVGQYYRAETTGTITGTPSTGLGERAGTAQYLTAYHLVNMNNAVTEDNSTPATFDDYIFAPGVRDAGLGWGFDYPDDTGLHEVRNLTFTFTVGALTTGGDVTDPCDVTVRALPQTMVWATSATYNDAPNRLYLAYTGGSSIRNLSFILPDNVPGTLIGDLVEGVNPVVVADPRTVMIEASDGSGWVATVAVAAQTLAGTLPSYGIPVRPTSISHDEYTSRGMRSLTLATPTYEKRLPPYRPYLGFPLIPPVLGGWHVGRAAMSTSGPW